MLIYHTSPLSAFLYLLSPNHQITNYPKYLLSSITHSREKFQDVRTKLKVAEIVKFMFGQIHVGNVNHEELRVFIVSGLEKSEGPDKSTQYKLKIMRPVMRKEQLIGVDKISNKSLSRDAYEAIINEAKRADETKYRILESKVAETKIEENRSLIKQVDSEVYNWNDEDC